MTGRAGCARALPPVAVALVLSACGGDTPTPVPAVAEPAAAAGDELARLAAGDPAFGGGAVVVRRLQADSQRALLGDANARDRWLQPQVAVHDAAAVALARELATPELLREVLPFLESPAGNALTAAETLALALFPQGPGFFAESMAWLGDPEHVGMAAGAAVANTAVQLGVWDTGGEDAAGPGLSSGRGGGTQAKPGASSRLRRREQAEGTGAVRLDVPCSGLLSTGQLATSPLALARTIAAACVEPEQARRIAAFAATAAGQRWIAVRTQAFARSEPRFESFVRAAEAAGFTALRDFGDAGSARLPEYLPRSAAAPVEPTASEIVVTIEVSDPGRSEPAGATGTDGGAPLPAAPGGRRYRTVIRGRTVAFRVGDVPCADVAALRDELVRRRATAQRVRIVPGAGVHYADLSDVADAAKAAGFADLTLDDGRVRDPADPGSDPSTRERASGR